MYAVNDFLSGGECDELIRIHDANVQKALRIADGTPNICFPHKRQHFRTTLNGYFMDRSYCLNTSSSRALRRREGLKWSYSTQTYRGKYATVDTIEKRIESVFGLNAAHGMVR